MHILNGNFRVSCRNAFSDYTSSLHRINSNTSVDKELRKHALRLCQTRESVFRTAFFQAETQIVETELDRKRPLDPGDDEEHGGRASISWIQLHGDLISSDSFHDNDLYYSEARALSPDSVLTVDIPGPNSVDYLVGPGTISSSLSLMDTSGQMVIDGVNITQTLMDIRKKAMLAGITEENACLASFIVTRDLLNSTFEPKDLDAVFPVAPPTYLEETEVAMGTMLSSMAGIMPFEELSQVDLRHNTCSTQSIVTRAINNYFAEAGLWNSISWTGSGHEHHNEDTFTDNVLKPLLSAAFGDLAGCSFRWLLDRLASSALVLAEIKTHSASTADANADLAKLFNRVKRSVDELYASGFHWPVILIQARGVTIDVYEFAIVGEAIHHPKPLGSFKAPATHLDIGLLLGLTPLLAARTIVQASFKAIKFGRTADLPKHWIRGTFDVRGISVLK
ncbi:hypothetical protein BG015_010065 [Linnemannia schmuckeri]|uniref:Uncharacterized protein n=1 Tax=Linnemannia schmuckeri TaxID=64567 RepID=A0A9P5RV23_9FUNG|nr:hypothetical protein BG015_010065 [Linnemannia schmuckeri]